jgi:hypothetical protein
MGLYHRQTNLWPRTANTTVPVCWVTPGWEHEKSLIREAVTQTWQKVTCLSFTDWGTYTAGTGARHVRLEITKATDTQGGGQALAKGSDALKSQGASVQFHLQSSTPIDRIRYLGIHEFGHVLGFEHENDSPDRDPNSSTQQPWGNVEQIGGWDDGSVMRSTGNVYGNAIGYLSRGDVASIRSLYGVRRVSIRGDFLGAGSCGWGVWRPSDGTWYIDDGATAPKVWGQAGDIPVPADYSGDGKTDRAVWRPSDGTWYVDDGATAPKVWGQAGDIPVPGDYDGDARAEMAVWRPSTGEWFINRLNGALNATLGRQGDIPVSGDYLGEGRARHALFRPTTGEWIFSPGLRPSYFPRQLFLGQNGDIPVPASFSENGIAEPAVWRPSSGLFIFASGWRRTWGQSGDTPLPRN